MAALVSGRPAAATPRGGGGRGPAPPGRRPPRRHPHLAPGVNAPPRQHGAG
ncbi:hypothetical protein M2316_003273, partial [Cellulosimicrobium cellulans]|nr:hypothetical protein [Cellulosimicrobium cellulans]